MPRPRLDSPKTESSQLLFDHAFDFFRLDPQIPRRTALGAVDPAFHKSRKVNLDVTPTRANVFEFQ